MIKAVITDLDDTLWDTSGQHIRKGQILALKEMAKQGLPIEEGKAEETRDMLVEKYGKHVNTTQKAAEHFGLHEKDSEEAERIRLAGHEAYYTAPVGDIRPFEDTIPTLKELKRRGKKIILLSYGAEGSQNAKIDRLGIRGYIDEVFIDSKIGNSDKEQHMRRIIAGLEKEGIRKDEMIVVGDNIDSEIKAANALGIISVRMRHGRREDIEPESEGQRSSYEIRKISEILDIIG